MPQGSMFGRTMRRAAGLLLSLALFPLVAGAVNFAAKDIPGGWVRRVVEAPSAPGTYFAASWGVYKSTDFGHTWMSRPYPMPAFDPNDYSHFPRHNTYDIAVCPTDPGMIIAGDQNETSVWRSTSSGDAGTWTAVTLENDTERRAVTMVSFSLTNANRCFAAGRINPNVGDVRDHILYKSDSQGAAGTWGRTGLQVTNSQTIMDTAQLPFTSNSGRIIAAVVDRYYAFVGDANVATTGKIYYSDDNGTTFTAAPGVSWAPYKFTWDAKNNVVWAIASDGAIYSSGDGVSWAQRRSAQITLSGGSGPIVYYKILYSVVSSTPMVFAMSSNGGFANQSILRCNVNTFPPSTWETGNYPTGIAGKLEGDIYDFVPDRRDTSGGKTWGVGTTLGSFSYTSDNGASYTTCAPGISTREVRYGAGKGGRIFASTFGNVLYVSTDSAATWTRSYPSLGGAAGGSGQLLVTIHPTDDGKVYLCDGSMVYVSTANGLGGFTMLSGPSQYPSGAQPKQLCNLIIHPSTPTVMFVGIATLKNSTAGNYLFKSVNSGTSWTAVPGLVSHGVNTIAFDPANPETIYASCGSGWGSRPFDGTGDGLYKSKDGGATWTKIGSNIFERGYLETMAFDPQDANTVITGGVYPSQSNGVSDAVHFSNDAGTHWKMLMMNGNQINTSKVFYYGSSIYIGNAEGFLYKSDDKGRTWGVAMMLPSMVEWVFDDSTGTASSAPYFRAPSGASVYAASQSGLFRVTGMGAASGISGGYGSPYGGGSGGIGDSDNTRAYSGSGIKLFTYPNPYNPSNGLMTIRLGLERDATKINVKLYSLSGELVIDSDLPARTGGTYYGLTWDGKNQKGTLCAPGLYFLVADVDGTKVRYKVVMVY